jgi:hypothetical protein
MSHSFPYVVPPTKRGPNAAKKAGMSPETSVPAAAFSPTRAPLLSGTYGAVGPSMRARLRSRSFSPEPRGDDADLSP